MYFNKEILLKQSPWPLIAGINLMYVAVGGAAYMHYYINGSKLLLVGIVGLIVSISYWFRDVIREGTYNRNYQKSQYLSLGVRIQGYIMYKLVYTNWMRYLLILIVPVCIKIFFMSMCIKDQFILGCAVLEGERKFPLIIVGGKILTRVMWFDSFDCNLELMFLTPKEYWEMPCTGTWEVYSEVYYKGDNIRYSPKIRINPYRTVEEDLEIFKTTLKKYESHIKTIKEIMASKDNKS